MVLRHHTSKLSLLLGVIFPGSFCLSLKSSSDRLPGWLRGTHLEPWLSQFRTGNQNIHDIAVGIMVSLFIYWLVISLPEYKKRKRVRRNLQRQYMTFKEECIIVFLNAMGQSCDSALIDRLKDKDEFTQFFKEPFCSEQTRWDAVANGLDAENIETLTVEFEILIAELHFTLIAVDVENQEVFAFLRNLANILYRARNCSPEYDSVKSLLGRMWSVYTGWSFVEGYLKKDVIAEMIEGNIETKRVPAKLFHNG